MNIIIAQIVGVVAVILLATSYQCKTKKKFLSVQTLTNIAYFIQYLLLGAKTAAMSSLISTVKTLSFYKYEKNDKKIPVALLIITSLFYGAIGIVAYDGLISLIPVIMAIIYTIGAWQSNLKVTYIIGTVVGLIWIFYNYKVQAYAGIIGNVIELTSGFIGFVRLQLSSNKRKNEAKE